MNVWISLTVGSVLLAAEPVPQTEKGTVRFHPVGDEKAIPETYRLKPHAFDWEMSKKADLAGSRVEIYRLRFPSPVKTDCPENNTVHAEYYRPAGKGPFPGVIILDITAGDQMLSRSIASHFAGNGVAGLFVQMAYYGPRRAADDERRLLSPNYRQTMAAIRQTVLDLRCAAAWLESRPEIDAKRLGILGTSLGSFMGTLTAEMDPRFRRVAVLLGGGGLVEAYYDDPRAASLRNFYEVLGGSREKLALALAPADPLTCAGNLKDRRVLILAAKRDEIVPPKMAEALWQATGKQKIVWYNCTHYGAALYIVPALRQLVEHYRTE